MYSHEHDAKLVIFLSVCNLISLFFATSPLFVDIYQKQNHPEVE